MGIGASLENGNTTIKRCPGTAERLDEHGLRRSVSSNQREMGLLRSLAYRSELTSLARFLRIADLLRSGYCRWAGPRDGIARFKVAGAAALFYARTPAELRGVEGTFLREEVYFLSVLLSTLRPGDVFFDIGSSFGAFAIPLAKLVGERGQVIAFEPERDAFKQLQKHVKLNGLSNVRTYQKALGQENAGGNCL